jgi:hypothetical protein
MPPAAEAGGHCIETNVGAAQRASFAYFGRLPFSGMDESRRCDYLLLQDSVRLKDEREMSQKYGLRDFTLLWEGRRPSDRNERFRLYQRR